MARLLLSLGADITKRGDHGTCVDVSESPEMTKLFEDYLASNGISMPSTRTEPSVNLNVTQQSQLIGPMKLPPRQVLLLSPPLADSLCVGSLNNFFV